MNAIRKGCERLESGLNRLLAQAAVARRCVVSLQKRSGEDDPPCELVDAFTDMANSFAGSLCDIADRLGALKGVVEEVQTQAGSQH